MYIPKINLTTDTSEIVAFMQQFSFATIITVQDNIPVATHLPFMVTIRDEKVVLASHFAKANDHWKSVTGQTALVIFTEPHAYISTQNYDKELNVPTWNYISVHAYGEASLITEPAGAMSVIESTINTYEASYRNQWDNFPEEYKVKMLNGIVAFEVVVTDLQAKKKLSQNRTATEKDKIIETLSASRDSNENLIAHYMKKEQ